MVVSDEGGGYGDTVQLNQTLISDIFPLGIGE